jgi:hypothetical protein
VDTFKPLLSPRSYFFHYLPLISNR